MDLKPSPFKIRPAERRDCSAIAGLIMELAVYEKMADQAKLTGADLERDAFDSNPPYFHCIVVEVNDSSDGAVVIGFALYFHHYSTWEGKMMYLEDFYVTPKYRHGGLGSKMIQYLAKMCVEGGFCRLKFECLEWNEPSIAFYKKHKAVNMTKTEGWNSFRFGKDELPALAAKYEQ